MRTSRIITIIGISSVLLILLNAFYKLLPGFNEFVISSFGLSLVLIYFILLILLSFYYSIDEKGISSKQIAFISIYSAFTAVARIPFAGVPGLQPCTTFILIAGMVFGPSTGFIIGANTAIISNIFLGQGLWTIPQTLLWGFTGILGSCMKKWAEDGKMFLTAIALFVFAFVYGALIDVWYIILYVRPITLEIILGNLAVSFYFNLNHAIGNIIFVVVFFNETVKILQMFKRRFIYQRVQNFDEITSG